MYVNKEEFGFLKSILRSEGHTRPRDAIKGKSIYSSYHRAYKLTKKPHVLFWRMIYVVSSWWHHQMETFSALLALCAGNSPATGEFSSQRPVTRSFDIFCDLCLNKRLSKQSWGWWFETPSRSLWRHRNVQWVFWELMTAISWEFVGDMFLPALVTGQKL